MVIITFRGEHHHFFAIVMLRVGKAAMEHRMVPDLWMIRSSSLPAGPNKATDSSDSVSTRTLILHFFNLPVE